MLYLLLLSNWLLSNTLFGRNGPRGEDSHPEFWSENGTPTPAVFDTTQKAKNGNSMTKVAKLKTKMRPSTHAAVEESILPVLSNKSFNKFPQWDFGDEYNEDTPPRTTVSLSQQDGTVKDEIKIVKVENNGTTVWILPAV